MKIAIFTIGPEDYWIRDTYHNLQVAGHEVVAIFKDSKKSIKPTQVELVKVDMPPHYHIDKMCEALSIPFFEGSLYSPATQEKCKSLEVDLVLFLNGQIDGRTIAGYTPKGALGLFLGRGANTGVEDAVKYSILDGIAVGVTAIRFIPGYPPAKVFDQRTKVKRGDTILEVGLNTRLAQQSLLSLIDLMDLEHDFIWEEADFLVLKQGMSMPMAGEKRMIAVFREYKGVVGKLP